MATTPSTEASIANSAAPSFEPRHSAPPVMQQPTVSTQEEEVVWDDSFMEVDYEEYQLSNPLSASVSTAQGAEISQTSLAQIIAF
jgi:hypothetical protein